MPKKVTRALSLLLAPALLLTMSAFSHGGVQCAGSSAPLVPQRLNYTENPVDVPNPDRGFYRANDGMVVPVTGQGSGTVNVGNSPVTVGGAVLDVGARIERCVMTTRAQPGGLERDVDVMRTLARERDACLAVGALVSRPGPVSVGDGVTITADLPRR